MSKTEYAGNIDGKSNRVAVEFPVASGVTVTAGDFVYFASGRITNASIAGARLIGRCEGTATGNAGGTVKARVCVDPNAKYLIDHDEVGGAAVVGDVGSYYDLVGATGAQRVDTSTKSATAGQVLMIEHNPQIAPYSDDTSYGLFVIAEHAFTL